MRNVTPLLLSVILLGGCSSKPQPYVIRHQPSSVAFGVFDSHPKQGPKTTTAAAIVGVTRTPGMPVSKQAEPPASFNLPKTSGADFSGEVPTEVGVPVPGKPGFFKSPYGSKDTIVDARGFEPGSEVRDPETGKTFLLPAK